MQPAPVSLPPEPFNGVTCGIDSAHDDHAVSVVDRSGRESQRWTVVHNEDGLRGLVRRLARIGVAEVTIERPDGPVVEALLGAGLTVVVISPNQLKNLRSRSAGAYCASIIPTASLRYGKRRKFTMKPVRLPQITGCLPVSTQTSCPVSQRRPTCGGDRRDVCGDAQTSAHLGPARHPAPAPRRAHRDAAGHRGRHRGPTSPPPAGHADGAVPSAARPNAHSVVSR